MQTSSELLESKRKKRSNRERKADHQRNGKGNWAPGDENK